MVDASDLKRRFADFELYEQERKPRTVKMYVRRLGYAERLTGKSIEEITADDLRTIKRKVIAGELTIGREACKGIIVAVRQFHRWGALEDLWSLNGIEHVRMPRIPRSAPDPLPLKKALALMAACQRPLEYRLIYLGLYAGCRIGESAPIEGAMWRDEDELLRFIGEKNDRIREVPIHPDLEVVKWQILAHPPSYDSTLQRVKRRLENRTGIRFVAHQLRDTFATRLYDAGTPDRIVKDLLGHSQDVTGSYVEVSRARKRQAISSLAY